jgi:hypothetical protein
MSKIYVIQWKSRVNGRMGRGTKLFVREEAEALAQELNREYPNIEHEVVDSLSPAAPATQPALSKAGADQDTGSGSPLQALAA